MTLNIDCLSTKNWCDSPRKNLAQEQWHIKINCLHKYYK